MTTFPEQQHQPQQQQQHQRPHHLPQEELLLVRGHKPVLSLPKYKRNVKIYFVVGFACLFFGLVWLMMVSRSLSVLSSSSSLQTVLPSATKRPEQQHNDEDTAAADHNKLHIVFSTDCSYYMDWLSYVFFYHAMEVKQPGHVTRIASGCTKTQRQALTQHFQDDIAIMNDNHLRFHLHFTPEAYPDVSRYFNKPMGVVHWMQHVLGFPHNRSQHEDAVVIIMDPDMILLQPLVNNFTAMPVESWNEGALQRRPIRTFVERGFPIAQQYGYRDVWIQVSKENMTSIVGPDSPVHNISEYEALWYFPAGPPYVVAALDLYQIAPLWLNFSMAFHRFSPQPMSEMYGYSIAAAHLKLPHQLGVGFMVSAPAHEAEGWQSVDQIPPSDICSDSSNDVSDQLPHIIHYCQQYSIGNYTFFKYLFYDSFLTCEGPLLYEPPKDAALLYNFSRLRDGTTVVWNDAKQILRQAFLTCRVIQGLNRAATFFKRNKCGDDANYRQGWSLFNDIVRH